MMTRRGAARKVASGNRSLRGEHCNQRYLQLIHRLIPLAQGLVTLHWTPPGRLDAWRDETRQHGH